MQKHKSLIDGRRGQIDFFFHFSLYTTEKLLSRNFFDRFRRSKFIELGGTLEMLRDYAVYNK